MKLRNKKTGEIGELQITEKHCAVAVGNGTASCGIEIYSSLAELNEEWEDYVEPKSFWTINTTFDCAEPIVSVTEISERYYNDEDAKSIGNYFETEEEAEKAVEKLKAWKRLKDKGFKFIGVRGIGKVIDFDIPKPYNHVWFDEYVPSEDEKEFYDDLQLLFGGEE